MTTDDVTGIDTEGGNDTSWPETIQVSSKVHSILVDVRTCMEQAPTNLLNDFIYWLFANPSKKFGKQCVVYCFVPCSNGSNGCKDAT